MSRDVTELVDPFLSDDPIRWGKLASDVQFRRLQLLLLKEILVELRELNRRRSQPEQAGRGETASEP